MPRKLSDAICHDKALELVGCLQMWGFERADAYVITREMKYRLQTMSDKEYVDSNPMKGTGLKPADAIEPAKMFEFEDAKNILEFPHKKT